MMSPMTTPKQPHRRLKEADTQVQGKLQENGEGQGEEQGHAGQVNQPTG